MTSLTILIPCLNEAETLGICVQKSKRSLIRSGLSGSVLVADNGSTDGSQNIAISEGADLVQVKNKGYGSVLMGGINATKTEYLIMGDADDSYALDDLQLFITKLDEGFDLVMGNRFQGGWPPERCPGFISISGTRF